jgi:beta-aspartyl-peptidase (threonine type)
MEEGMQGASALIVHGGAWDIPREVHGAHVEGVRGAARLGWELLQAGKSALDVAERVVRMLEDDPAFNAGRGSGLNAAGQVELDALIMDGATLENGAVAAVQHIANPISLARLVMARTEHALLVGAGALAFAREMGIGEVPEEALLVGRELERWRALQRDRTWKSRDAFEGPAHGTVGAVARDQDGHIAAATSTGGTPKKMAGRVGDSPLVGCGGYADDRTGGASATGLGESLMKVVISKLACDLAGAGLAAQAAAEEAVRRLGDERVKGLGGVIVVDYEGRVGYAYNTPYMARAYVLPDGTVQAAI